MFEPSPRLLSYYESRLLIPLEGSTEPDIMLKTETGLLVAINYQRVVIGQRGPYIEFKKEHLAPNYFVPPEQEWRLTSSFVYYIEYRTTDKSRIKIYFQQKTVSYADYKIGFFYISPVDLYLRNECVLQEKARSPQLPLW